MVTDGMEVTLLLAAVRTQHVETLEALLTRVRMDLNQDQVSDTSKYFATALQEPSLWKYVHLSLKPSLRHKLVVRRNCLTIKEWAKPYKPCTAATMIPVSLFHDRVHQTP